MYRQIFKLLLVVCLSMPFVLSAQIIKGKVYRAGTTEVIVQASVYYSGSLTGTSTNENGAFQLQQISGKIPIVVSCVGYYSTVVSDYNNTDQLTVYLKPKVNELADVTISAGGGSTAMSRADLERMFTREFIGTTENALSCIIVNMDDIDLHYSKAGTLTAFCDKPIQIDNKRLAYHIVYYLDRFVKTTRNTIYEGNYIFKDQLTADNAKKVNSNRAKAYSGSRMEFVRALWSNALTEQGYKIYSPMMTPLTVDSVLFVSPLAEKFVALRYKIMIVHNNDKYLLSHLSQTVTHAYIDKNGFLSAGLQWFGYMGTQRVGDMLPFEYSPAKDTAKQ